MSYTPKTLAPAIDRAGYISHLARICDSELDLGILDALRLGTEAFIAKRISGRDGGLRDARLFLRVVRANLAEANVPDGRASWLKAAEKRLVAALVMTEIMLDEGGLSTTPPLAPVRPIEVKIDQQINLPPRSTETSVIRDEFGNITKATTRDLPA